jgi:hypothetical protein
MRGTFLITSVAFLIGIRAVMAAEMDCVNFADTLKNEMKGISETDDRVLEMMQALLNEGQQASTPLEPSADLCNLAKDNVARAETLKKLISQNSSRCQQIASSELEAYEPMFYDAPTSRSAIKTLCEPRD